MKKGFTVVEFMIVVAILGIILAIAVPMCGDLNAKRDLKSGKISQFEYNKQRLDSGYWVHPETGYSCSLGYAECNQLRETYMTRVKK